MTMSHNCHTSEKACSVSSNIVCEHASVCRNRSSVYDEFGLKWSATRRRPWRTALASTTDQGVVEAMASNRPISCGLPRTFDSLPQ